MIPNNILEHQRKLDDAEKQQEMIKKASKTASSEAAANKRKAEAALKKAEAEARHLEYMEEATRKIEVIIDNQNLYQMGTGKVSWWKQNDNKEWLSMVKDTLIASNPFLADRNVFIKFTELMVEKDRVIDKIIMSWDKKTGNRVLNQLEKNFLIPEDDSIEHDWMIDAVFTSIAGDNHGAVENLEKTIYCKYLHPENFMLPNPFFNDDGETGKSLLVSRMLTPLFGGATAPNADMAHITGMFNKSVSGKAIIFVNETVKESVMVDRLKAFLGSPTIIINEKFQPAIEAENTALVIGSTNDKAGAVMLSGGGADRRFSIFSSKNTLNDVVLSYLIAENESFGEHIFQVSSSTAEIRSWIKEVGQFRLSNKKSLGRWLNKMHQKYGDILSVEPFHSDDYRAQLERQRPAWLESVEKIFIDPTFEYIRNNTLGELIRHLNPNERNIPGKKKMKELLEKLCQDKGITVKFDPKFNCKHNGIVTSTTVWKHQNQIGSIVLDEKKYYEDDVYGRKQWKWIE